MHLGDPKVIRIAEKLQPLIESADVFYAEMDLAEQPVTSVVPPHYNILQHFTPKRLEKMRRQFKRSFGIDLLQLGHLHPLLIISALTTHTFEQQEGVLLDEYLWQLAIAAGKPVKGLESREEQITILHSIHPQPLYRQLYRISRTPSSIRDQSSKVMELYLDGNMHQLYHASKKSMRDLRKLVIYDRNKKMSSVIAQLDNSLQYFICAGAGHLSGRFGLIPLLKQQGWIVKPVSLKV